MKTVMLWRWRVPDDRRPGRTYVTRWAMSEAEALARWPTAERVGDPQLHDLPETQADFIANATSSFQRRPPSRRE
jgi:hypothetical protein